MTLCQIIIESPEEVTEVLSTASAARVPASVIKSNLATMKKPSAEDSRKRTRSEAVDKPVTGSDEQAPPTKKSKQDNSQPAAGDC